MAVAAVLVAALSGASFRMVGPLYGEGVGLNANQIGTFLAAYIAGGALAQYPVGWLADKYDRRWVMVWLSVAAVISCGATVATANMGTSSVMAAAFFFGLTTFPIYSVATAHAHDFATSAQRVELSAALMFFYAVGAIAAPLTTSSLIEAFGPAALFYFISVGHILLIVFAALRMRVRGAPSDRTRYVYAPRTSFLIGRLLGRSRENTNISQGTPD